MTKTFVAHENPASMLGVKADNTEHITKTHQFSKELKGKQLKKAVEKHKKITQEKYQARRAAVDKQNHEDINIQELMRREDTHVVSDWARGKENVFLASSGSLTSMFSRLIAYCKRTGSKFDTLVFVGHGGTGKMSVGSGRMRLSEKTAERLVDSGCELDHRHLSFHNENTWVELFANIKDCIDKDSPCVYVFLLGCGTAEMTDGGTNQRTIASVVAKRLSAVFNKTVVAFGATSDITVKDQMHVLKNLDKIKELKHEHYPLKSEPTLFLQRFDSSTPLAV